MSKRPLRAFLAMNPFPHPMTEGFFYREKMRAIHRVAPDAPFTRILEVGGGRSGLTRMLYPDATVVNLDMDPTLRGRAGQPRSEGDLRGGQTRRPCRSTIATSTP